MSYHAAIRKYLTAQWHNGTIPGVGGLKRERSELTVCLFQCLLHLAPIVGMSYSDASNAIREGIGTSRWRYRNKPSEASERNLGDIGIKRRGNGTYNRKILTFEINREKACRSQKIVVPL